MSSIANIYGGQPVLSEAYRWTRRNLEWLVTAAIGALILIKHNAIVDGFSTGGGWDIHSFYGAVFNWSSLQSAFLFSVYAFFLSRSEPFIQAIASTQPFQALRRYVLRSLTLSITLTICSLPLLVKSPPVLGVGAPGFLVFLSIASLLTYTFMCFVKVIRVFRKLERVRD